MGLLPPKKRVKSETSSFVKSQRNSFFRPHHAAYLEASKSLGKSYKFIKNLFYYKSFFAFLNANVLELGPSSPFPIFGATFCGATAQASFDIHHILSYT